MASQPAAAVRVAFVSPAPASQTKLPQPQNNGVLFAEDFDKRASAADLRARYFEYDDARGGFVWEAGAGIGGQGGAMRCTFDRGQVTAGNLKVVFGRNPFGKGIHQKETFREIYWRVYVKHEAGWQGNPAKLARATTMAGRDWSQGLIAHVWGGKGDVLCIDPATGITDSRKVTTRYNDFAHLRWLGVQHGRTPIFSPGESGRWVCVESHVRVNTPGVKDGVFELFIDGQREARRTDLDWHGAWDEYGINAVFLENYWNSGSVKRQSRWFDAFVVSARPVGPLVAKLPVRLTRTAVSGLTAWEAQAAADPAGRAIVWSSPLIGGERVSIIIGRLTPGGTYWLRLRQRDSSGGWSQWTPWHAPFRLPG